jgi:hypothetical protein
LDAAPQPRKWTKRFTASACAVLVAIALVLALVWFSSRGGPDWTGQQRDGLHALVERELPQATSDQQGCVVDYVTGHFSPEHWSATVQQYAELGPFSGDAVVTFANVSGCASK